jgi:hypothetical protein
MTANTSILTYNNGVVLTEALYYAPVSILPVTFQPVGTLYAFLAKAEPWDDEFNPPTPREDQKYIKQVFKNMFVAKEITTNDMCPVTNRVDWIANTVYDYYDDSVDMFTRDSTGVLTKKFYVKNKFDQVFKCLWNNNSSQSIYEPYFEPGTFNPNLIFQAADGYKWKYIYTVTSGIKNKFMDNAWLPVPVGTNTPNPLMSSSGAGSIDVINVINTGSGYDPANTIIKINVVGDGSGATANAAVTDGAITDIVVYNKGKNYTYANVEIVTTAGSGCVAFAPASPVGGHGHDPVSELGASNLMITSVFDGSEGGVIPTDIDYHQLGLLVSPSAVDTSPNPANSAIYSTTTDFIVSLGAGVFQQDELLYQSTDYTFQNANFVARVLSFNTSTNVVKLINITGNYIINAPVYGKNTGTVRTLLQVQEPRFVTYSGYMPYIENRSGVQRSSDGSEQFRLVLRF